MKNPKNKTEVNKYIATLRFNSHNFGEMGKFIRLEYAENIVKEIFLQEYAARKQ